MLQKQPKVTILLTRQQQMVISALALPKSFFTGWLLKSDLISDLISTDKGVDTDIEADIPDLLPPYKQKHTRHTSSGKSFLSL